MNNAGYLLFETQRVIVELTLALAESDPKRDSIFETKYKTENGKEITVARSPDGKFANKSGGATPSNRKISSVSIEKAFAESFSGFADNIAKMPAKIQDAVRKAVFDSEFSRAIDKETEKLVKSAYDPGLAIGFKLGQGLKDELAKTSFPDFAKTSAEKFAQFRKELPQKGEDLRREIVRIAKDPNTSTTIAVGALMGLAAYFHIAGLFKIVRAGQIAYGLSKIPKDAAIEIEKEFARKAMEALPGLSKQDAIETVTGMGQQAVSALKLAGAIDIGLHFIGAGFNNIVSTVLTSQVGRIIMNQAKKNELIEKEQLKAKIIAKPESAEIFQRQMSEQSEKEEKTKKKILAGLRQEISKEELVNIMMNATLPTLSIEVGEKNEDYLTKNPEESSRIFRQVYEDASVKKLFTELDTAMAAELEAIFADKLIPQTELRVDAIKQDIENAVAKLVKEEVERQQAKR